jgi:hypothetical protein
MTTFETYSILLNTTIGVLIVGYGIWLRNIFKHQIEAKDATIEAKNAEISRLRADSAPAIADAYTKMRAHADQMTRDVGLLNQKLDSQTKETPQLRAIVEIRVLAYVIERMAELGGSNPDGRSYTSFLEWLLADVDKKLTEFPNLIS